uniref:glutamate ligase domain-containing protein n=1 Tax=Proteiniclasticum sp. TaxID=2053595 RepID=UPI0037C8384B
METFGGVERRFQYIYDGDFIIIDDHFANTSNIDMTLESLVKLEYEKLHLVYAIRGNRGPVVNRENLETLLKWKEKLHMDEIIGTKSVEFVTDKDRVTKEEIRTYESMLEHSGLEVHLYEELRPAIAYAIDKAQKGDVILLAGSQGMDHGARIALEYIYRKGIEEDRESLFSVLRDRVSDMS